MSKQKAQLVEFLVDEVQIHPCIWHKGSPEYKDTFRKANAWDTIAINTKSQFQENDLKKNKMDTLEGLKGTWRAQRDKFSKIKREMLSQTRSGAGLADVQGIDWYFYKKLQFLEKSQSSSAKRESCGISTNTQLSDAMSTNQDGQQESEEAGQTLQEVDETTESGSASNSSTSGLQSEPGLDGSENESEKIGGNDVILSPVSEPSSDNETDFSTPSRGLQKNGGVGVKNRSKAGLENGLRSNLSAKKRQATNTGDKSDWRDAIKKACNSLDYSNDNLLKIDSNASFGKWVGDTLSELAPRARRNWMSQIMGSFMQLESSLPSNSSSGLNLCGEQEASQSSSYQLPSQNQITGQKNSSLASQLPRTNHSNPIVSTISHPVTGAKIYKIALPAKKPTQALPISIQNAIQKIQLPIQTTSHHANSANKNSNLLIPY